jgi:hypothetical protein
MNIGTDAKPQGRRVCDGVHPIQLVRSVDQRFLPSP